MFWESSGEERNQQRLSGVLGEQRRREESAEAFRCSGRAAEKRGISRGFQVFWESSGEERNQQRLSGVLGEQGRREESAEVDNPGSETKSPAQDHQSLKQNRFTFLQEVHKGYMTEPEDPLFVPWCRHNKIHAAVGLLTHIAAPKKVGWVKYKTCSSDSTRYQCAILLLHGQDTPYSCISC